MEDAQAGGARAATRTPAGLTGAAPPPGAVAFLGSWVAVGGWLVVGALFGGSPLSVAPEVGLYLSLGVYGLIVVPLLAATAGPTLRAFLTVTPAAVVVGVLAGGLMAAATLVVYPVAVALFPGVREVVSDLYASAAIGPPAPVRLALLVVIIAAEEVLWRGVLLTGLRVRFGRRAAVVIAAVTYGLAQLGTGSFALFALAVACGVIWGAQRLWHGSLVVPFLTHLVWDVALLVVMPVESPAPFAAAAAAAVGAGSAVVCA